VALTKVHGIHIASRSLFFFAMLKALFVCVLASAPAIAKENPRQTSACREMPNHDARCTQRERNRIHERFGLPTLKQMHFWQKMRGENGSIVVGILQIKLGGGFAFLARRNHHGLPEIEVREVPGRGLSKQARIQRTRLSEASWAAIMERAQALDVDFYDERICVGGSGATIEVIDGQGRILSRLGDACPEHPAKEYVHFLAETAVTQLPHCAAVHRDTYASPFHVLEACAKFEGLKLVAGELNNTLDFPEGESFWRTNGNGNPLEILDFFDKDIELSWRGLPLIKGRRAAADFWTDEALSSIDFESETIRAETYSQVSVAGRVIFRQNETDQHGERERGGTFISTWRRDGDGRFKMHRFRYVATRN
jgi:hypothetical protein